MIKVLPGFKGAELGHDQRRPKLDDLASFRDISRAG
jgi:hypothetical protein